MSSHTNVDSDALVQQVPRMAKTLKKKGLGRRIATAREQAKLNQTEFGAVFGLTRSAVSQWESDTTEPTPEKLRAIAVKTGADFDWLATGRGSPKFGGDMRSEDVAATLDGPTERKVKLKGYVGAGSKAHFYAVADEDFEEVPAPDNANDQTIALQIKGKSWGPAMDTWLVFYDDVRSPITPDMLGQPCVVGLADDRILLKVIKSDGRGGFDLYSNSSTEDVIRDAEIEWAAKVTSMRPR